MLKADQNTVHMMTDLVFKFCLRRWQDDKNLCATLSSAKCYLELPDRRFIQRSVWTTNVSS